LEGALADFAELVDTNGATPLVWAISNGSLEVVQTLLKHPTCNKEALNRQDRDGRTPLHASAFAGNVAATDELLSAGVSVDLLDTVGQSPIFTACEHGHGEVVNALLAAKARIDFEDSEGRHAMHWASIGGFETIVAALLEAGSSPLHPDGRGETSLHYAAFFGRTNCAMLLCDASYPDVQDYDGITPVHWTALQGHPETLTALLERGAYANYMEARAMEEGGVRCPRVCFERLLFEDAIGSVAGLTPTLM
jgi:ankyrin repeat protein